MQKLGLKDIGKEKLRGRRVLLRVDYNVPVDARGSVTDDTRIRATLRTLDLLIRSGARIIVLSHFGRPKGQHVPEMSLRPAARRLADLVDVKVDFIGDTIGAQANQAAMALGDGEILVLENTRFLPGEEENDRETAEALAELGEIYVNDAFGAAHRAHASTTGVAEVVRERGGLAIAGLLMQKELEYLGGVLADPERPFVAILGGAKISGKIDVIESLLPQVDRLLIGGAMANTFFRAMGHETGSSLVENDRLDMAKELIERGGEKLVLPIDVVVASEMKDGADTEVVALDGIPADGMALDIGPSTARRFAEEIGGARTVLWNGPMGVSEIREFAAGTESVARALASATEGGAITIVGGGDSAAAITELGLSEAVSHVSTGGGASLEFLEGRQLPGVAVLCDAEAS